MAEMGHSQLERASSQGSRTSRPTLPICRGVRLRGYLCPVRIEIAPDRYVAALTALGALPQPKTHI